MSGVEPGDDAQDDRRRTSRHTLPLVSLLGALLVATLAGPGIVHQFSKRLDHAQPPAAAPAPLTSTMSTVSQPGTSNTSTTGVTTDTAATTTAAASQPDGTVADGGGPVASGTVPSTTTTTTATSATPTSVALTRVITLQLVPAVRDVIVRVGGVERASDAFGRIDVSGLPTETTLEFVGIQLQPSIVRAEFTSWSDGSTTPQRTLGELTGPTASLALVVSSRVVATTRSGAEGTVVLTSERGPIELATGMLQWVPFTQGIAVAEGLLSQQLTYTTTSLSVDGVAAPLRPQQFVASPEAAWVIDA